MELVSRTRRWAHPHHSTGASTRGALAGPAGAGNGAVAATSRFVWDGGMSVSVPAPRGGTIGWQWPRPAGSQEGQPAGPVDVQHAIPWDTSTATGRLVLAVIGAVGQAEREATFAQRAAPPPCPCRCDAYGLPVVSRFAARLGAEATSSALAYELEEAQPWLGRRPPIFRT